METALKVSREIFRTVSFHISSLFLSAPEHCPVSPHPPHTFRGSLPLPKKSMEKLKKLSAAMGEIRGKYGADAVIRGSVLEQREKEKKYEKKQF